MKNKGLSMKKNLLAYLLLFPLYSLGCLNSFAQENASPLQVKIQELYVGILGRAADRPGLDYWADQINAGVFTLENTRAAFTDPAQTEYTEIYGGLNNTQLVTAIYENFLERAPELAGLQYWVGELDNGRVNADQMINAIINAVQDPTAIGEAYDKDRAVLENKTAAAVNFTELTQEFYFDAAFQEAARATVANVTEDLNTLEESRAKIDEFVVRQRMLAKQYPTLQSKIQAYDQLWELLETEFETLRQQYPKLILLASELDLENDNDMDLLISMNEHISVLGSVNLLYIVRNNLELGFSMEQLGFSGSHRDYVVADFNGDGLDDVYNTDHGYDFEPFPGQEDTLLLQTPAGTMIDTSDQIIPTDALFSHGICGGDIDNDGDIDVNVTVGRQYIFANDGQGMMLDESEIRLPMLDISADHYNEKYGEYIDTLGVLYHSWCHMEDVNNDGYVDLLLGDNNGDISTDADENLIGRSHLRLLNDGNGVFLYEYPGSVIPNTITPGAANNTVEMNSFDVNSDGCNDLITVTTNYESEQHVNVFTGDCTGGFELNYNHVINNTPAYTSYLDIIDINDDGLDDFVTTVTHGEMFMVEAINPRIYINNGDGTFDPRAISEIDPNMYSPLLFLKLMWSRQLVLIDGEWVVPPESN